MSARESLVFQLPSFERVQAEYLRRNFHAYVKAAWHVIEPAATFVDNWHIETICQHLQAVTRGTARMRKEDKAEDGSELFGAGPSIKGTLIINIPFRSSKSSIVSVLWPTWEWISFPHLQYLTASYDGDLSTRDCVNARRLIQSPWYQARWGHQYSLLGDQNVKTRYQNSSNGHRIALTVAGGVTGEGGDRRLIDDPHDAVKAKNSPTERLKGAEWYDHGMSNRENVPGESTEVIIMQRVAMDDLVGHVKSKVAQGGGELHHIMIPMEYDGVRRKSVLGYYDPRTKKGELMWPKRFDSKWLKLQKAKLGSYGVASQLQQQPTPQGGFIFKRDLFKFVREMPAKFDEVILSLDCAFKDLNTSDFVAIQAWGCVGQVKYQLRRFKDRLSFTETLKLAIDWSNMFPEADTFLVEDKANGPAVINVLKDKIPGLLPFNPNEYGSKVARGYAIQPQQEAGQIVLWHPDVDPGTVEFLEEVCAVPGAPNDDEFDAMTQAVLHMSLRFRKFQGLMEYTKQLAQEAKAERGELEAARNQTGVCVEEHEEAFWHSVQTKRKEGQVVS